MHSKSALHAERQRWRTAVATVLAATRRDHDVTQPELAKRVGWSRDKLAKVESATRRVEFGDVILLANALGERPELVLRRILGWNG
jgi:transcriptional regulator with XRE-family HTH domain